MTEYRFEYSDLNKRIAMEALITERIGMEWENHHQIFCSKSPIYGDVAFNSIASQLRELVEDDDD